MTLLTIDDIAAMVKLSRKHTLDVLAKQDGFPAPVIGVRKPRWDAAAVNKYLRFPQKANTPNPR